MPPMSLGDINVASHDFFNSIDLFYVHFHPQLPFLPGKRALLQDSLNCALLAWALFTVAARVSPDPNLNSIRVRLTWPVRRLASQSILAPRSLPAIQALLILCLWPMPYAALIDDPSWVFSGMAIQKALQLGMYRPLESLIDYAKGDHRVARSMQDTWLACLVVGQMQSTRHGIPSTIPLEHMDPQLQLSQGATVPSQMLRAAVELARKDMVISSLLSHRDGAGMPPDRPPALRALGIELEHLDAKIQQCQSPLLQRMLCSTKIRLYSFALRAEHDAPATGIGGKEDLIIYISKAYAVARHIIINSLEDQVGKWSFIDLQSFIMALFIVLHISRRHHSVCNVQQVLEMFQRASALLKSCSVIDGDHFYRVCEIINYLLAQPPAGSESSDQPVESEAMATTIQPAAGIGVAYDIIKEAKKRYRRSVWFPEEFPDLSSSAAVELETGSSSAGVGAGDWIQEDPLMQSMFAPDLNIASWLGPKRVRTRKEKPFGLSEMASDTWRQRFTPTTKQKTTL
ncbi:hypothetical protein B0H67DRAFT_98217 [Lasiosphaeris hirsuta]|uniref:Xylanolytic transcriptional activator regulatory domain-containing protein n=1 Tax=Lasiosphaeris hirsuta TaxID=260670 RepID=A0AA39ZPK0_9PEZI|nr:hypothetical protein B0H67DRAFT_98217 [Lasiosphaeris hirsuta]